MNKFSIFLLTCITAFHIPDFKVDSKIDVDGSSHNSGLIHSSIRQNWSQSLNVGSVSIAATLVILFITLIMYLRIQERINDLVKCVKQLQNDFAKATKQRNNSDRKPRQELLSQFKKDFETERSIKLHLPLWFWSRRLLVPRSTNHSDFELQGYTVAPWQ